MSAGELLARHLPSGQVLDWRDAAHWSRSRRCCLVCGGLTNLRDESGQASHKTCQERVRRLPSSAGVAA